MEKDNKKKGRRLTGDRIISLILAAGLLVCLWQIVALNRQTARQEWQLQELAGREEVSLSVSASWTGKKWASYGDSITEIGGWQDYITDYFGFSQHYNCGIGSTTFTKSDLVWLSLIHI